MFTSGLHTLTQCWRWPVYPRSANIPTPTLPSFPVIFLRLWHHQSSVFSVSFRPQTKWLCMPPESPLFLSFTNILCAPTLICCLFHTHFLLLLKLLFRNPSGHICAHTWQASLLHTESCLLCQVLAVLADEALACASPSSLLSQQILVPICFCLCLSWPPCTFHEWFLWPVAVSFVWVHRALILTASVRCRSWTPRSFRKAIGSTALRMWQVTSKYCASHLDLC